MFHPLAVALALHRQRTGEPAPTVETNRTINTISGWTFPGYSPGTLAPSSRLPCSLDISDPENPTHCYWCARSLESHNEPKETE